jgi:hypothetical protein
MNIFKKMLSSFSYKTPKVFVLENNSISVKKSTQRIMQIDNIKVDTYTSARDVMTKMNGGTHYDYGAIKDNIVENDYDALGMMLKTIDPKLKIVKYHDDISLEKELLSI